MKSRRAESFEKIEGESFYTSPPYNYRPSIAEFLSTADVTLNGFIADILHLDYKKNIKIKSFKKDYIIIELIDNNNLNLTEIYIWNYLISIKKNNEVILFPNKIPRSIIREFSSLVRIKISQKFNSGLFKYSNISDDKIGDYKNSLFGYRILVGFISSFLGFIGFIIALILGNNKLKKYPEDKGFFIRKFILRYIKYFITYAIVIVLFGLSYELIINKLIINDYQIISLMLYLVLYGLIWAYMFYQYSKIAYDYISWLFESAEAGDNRREWLKFKRFVIKNSELEKTPLAHYKLWGPFYYYTLATGGIKSLVIR